MACVDDERLENIHLTCRLESSLKAISDADYLGLNLSGDGKRFESHSRELK